MSLAFFLEKKWLKSQWIPKELTEVLKRKHGEFAIKLFRRYRRLPFLKIL